MPRIKKTKVIEFGAEPDFIVKPLAVPTEAKPWYKSWTVWFNVAILILGTVNEFAKIIPISPEIVASAAALGNLLLRIKTVMPVKF